MATESSLSLPEANVESGNSDIEVIAAQVSTSQKSNGDLFPEVVEDDKRTSHNEIELPNIRAIFGEGEEATSKSSGNHQGFVNTYQEQNQDDLSTFESTNNESDKNYLLAATYIEDARFGRTLEYNTDDKSLINYRKYSNIFLRWGTLLILTVLLLLALFEDPAVEGLSLDYWITMLIELACLAVIGFRIYQLSTFVPRRALLLDPKNIVVVATILITLLDMIIYIGMYSSPNTRKHAIRISRVFRPLFLINMNESRQVRRAFRNIRNTVPEIINVLILFIFSIVLFTLLAFKLFEYRGLVYRSGEGYFDDYGDAFFDLYVLVTTANSPDVMMPAYDDSPWFALFFIVYIITNTYIFINLFLAVIYNSYRTHLQTEIRASVLWKRQKLEQAFNLLKESDDNPVVTSETWVVTLKRLSRPPTFAKINLYWEVLSSKIDENGQAVSSATLTKSDFLQVADLLNVYIVQDTTYVNIFIRLIPGFYLSKPSSIIRTIVKHRFFAYVFDVLIIANAVCIGTGVEETEWFFLSVFMLEIVLKIYTYGPREYFSRENLWNWFDFTIIMAAFITTVIEASLDELQGFPREALDFLLVLRCLRLVKIVSTFERFRVIIMTILNIAPSLAVYGIVLLLIYYSFAIIGMESFAGKIRFIKDGTTAEENLCGNPKLANSEFVRVGYCGNNFNEILRSFVTLVELTVVNQWHTRYSMSFNFSYIDKLITLGFTTVTNKAARLYFVIFHLIVVILIMNIIVAFVLEAFILEYRLSKNNIECKVEKTIEQLGLMMNECVFEESENRTRTSSEENPVDSIVSPTAQSNKHYTGPHYSFRINKGHKNVEVLLQRMFEGELNDNLTSSNEQTLTLEDAVGTSVTI